MNVPKVITLTSIPVLCFDNKVHLGPRQCGGPCSDLSPASEVLRRWEPGQPLPSSTACPVRALSGYYSNCFFLGALSSDDAPVVFSGPET